jgi:hypothetical protein
MRLSRCSRMNVRKQTNGYSNRLLSTTPGRRVYERLHKTSRIRSNAWPKLASKEPIVCTKTENILTHAPVLIGLIRGPESSLDKHKHCDPARVNEWHKQQQVKESAYDSCTAPGSLFQFGLNFLGSLRMTQAKIRSASNVATSNQD